MLAAAAERAHLAVDPQLCEDIAAEMVERDSLAPELVGHVYERRVAQCRARRRASGVYYTPEHLVELTVERTVGAAMGRQAPLELSILDPACGGGVFLLAALRAVANRTGAPLAEVGRRVIRGFDIDPTAVDVCRLALSLAGAPSVDVRVADGLLAPAEPVDVVLGNPPWGQKQFRVAPGTAEKYRRRFRCGRGVLDPFKLFIERAHELTRPGGRWGMVLPDIVLLKNQQPVRDVMLEGSELEWIAHAGRAFDGVNLDAVVIAGRRVSRVSPRHRVSIWHELPKTWRRDPPATHTLDQSVFRSLPGHKLNIYLTDESLALVTRLERGARFGDRFEIHEGVHTGNSRGKLLTTTRRNPRCAELIVGRSELKRYELSWSGTYLDMSPEAIDRHSGDYCNLGRPHWHASKKLVVRRTGDRVIAAYDKRGRYVTNNMFVALARGGMTAAEHRAYVALLNSSLMTWYFRTVQPRTGRLFAELKIQHLAVFPLPSARRWARAAPRLAKLCRLAEARGAAAVQARVDAEVENLYQLSPQERSETKLTR